MKLTEQHIIKKSHPNFKEIDNLCFLSKNLYNSGLYSVRQHFFQTQEYLNKFKNISNFTKDKQKDYVALPAVVAQQTLLMVDENFQSFFKSLKAKKNGTYKQKVNIPKYLDKDGKFILVFPGQCKSNKEFRKGIIKLVKTNIRIKTDKKNINQVRIIPKNGYYVIEIIYEVNEKELHCDNERYASIDLGINNLATITSNITKPLIINGKPLKSINQFYNKKKAELQESLQTKHKVFTSKKLKSLTNKRNNKIKDYLHKSSKEVINHLVSNQINTLIIGYNKGWKQEVNIGRINNQKFVVIPYLMFINMLKYKAKLVGITVILHEESYTSKCSFLDNEVIGFHDEYLGKRVHRGLFKSSSGKLINADVNGSLNIMRKVVPNALIGYGIEVCSTPVVLTIKHN